MMRRSAPVLRRQVSVQVPPVRLFGAEAIALVGSLDTVTFVSSHEEQRLRLEPIDAPELVSRMTASLAHERHELLTFYRHFRFAFPNLESSALEGAERMEAALLEQALASLPVSWLRHPYPCDIGSPFAPIAELLA
ncbi:MAG: hypothetical protein M3452_06005 [Chloroflexota bacterium]|nr:hypothetical protein [Chloroflexota bacterium]